LATTWRYRWIDRSGFFESGAAGPAIYCFWHNRLALCLPVYIRYVKKRSHASGIAALVSASRDGALLASVLKCFKVEAVRGSSSRRGSQALLELTTLAQRGYDLAITPDGPRGPRYLVREGVISLAQLTGWPIIPASTHVHTKFCLKSWDAFQIPLPFSRCEIVFAKPIRVPRDVSDAEREQLRKQLEQTLKAITAD
ncbi:MAG TPA: lysophospholipid acyltransferase family protein, partial [Verrucomicrobiae bacterium]|nr:lysophospholipid acyltransferase family protein [Verrucomicrobiae bacterium]